MEMEARMRAEYWKAERAARLPDQHRMSEMFQYMQSLGTTHGLSPAPLLFPLADLAQFHTLVSIKILVLHDIYSFGLTHAIYSLYNDNRWHQTTFMDRSAHRQTYLAAYLAEILCAHDLMFVGVINTL
jgi:hypothetical protein